MLRLSLRLFVVVGVVLATGRAAIAQIAFTHDYTTSSTANPGFYTTEYRAAITRAGLYASSQFDGRGTVTVQYGALNLGSQTLAFGGTFFFFQNGGFTNGTTFQQATAGNVGSNSSFVDFNSAQANWYAGESGTVPNDKYDFQSVALHELTHGFGFTSLIKADGAGLQNLTPGQPDTYSQLDRRLRLGSAANAPLVITSGGTFNTAQVTAADLAGSNIYFHGEMATAANSGAAIRMTGGNLSHIGDHTASVMYPSFSFGENKRAYSSIDMAMLIDMGWNQFVWKNATGNFADNIANLSGARWENLDRDDVLSPVGTITTNAVLRFAGTGGYTATNNLNLTATGNRHLVTRIILNATAGTSTIAATGSNAFRFDSTIGVAPQIRQDGAGAFNISHPLDLTGRNLELAGNGAGRVTLAGTIGQQSGQTGSIIKSGTSTFALGGNNTYTGGTTVNGGTLLVTNTAGSGSGTGTGAVAVNSGGTLGGTGTISGATTVNAGGTIRGDSGTGTGTLNLANTTILGAAGSTGGTLAARLAVNGGGTVTGNSKLALGSNTLNLVSTGGKFNIVLLADGGLTSGQAYTIILATGGLTSYQRNGVVWNAILNPFTTADYTVTSGSGAWTFSNTLLGVDGSNNLTLQFTPVPEPGTVLAAAGAGVLALGGIRRRFRVTSPALSA